MFAGSPLATNPLFQQQMAVADTELRASRILLHAAADECWTSALDRRPLSPDATARTRAAAAWATDRAAHIVDVAHRFAGGTAVYADSPLQRRLRDVHTLTQHFIVRPDTLTSAGAVLAGQDPGVPVF
jgi:alkylation response protein AidB-like acyl-CoA dehydrogenase